MKSHLLLKNAQKTPYHISYGCIYPVGNQTKQELMLTKYLIAYEMKV